MGQGMAKTFSKALKLLSTQEIVKKSKKYGKFEEQRHTLLKN